MLETRLFTRRLSCPLWQEYVTDCTALFQTRTDTGSTWPWFDCHCCNLLVLGFVIINFPHNRPHIVKCNLSFKFMEHFYNSTLEELTIVWKTWYSMWLFSSTLVLKLQNNRAQLSWLCKTIFLVHNRCSHSTPFHFLFCGNVHVCSYWLSFFLCHHDQNGYLVGLTSSFALAIPCGVSPGSLLTSLRYLSSVAEWISDSPQFGWGRVMALFANWYWCVVSGTIPFVSCAGLVTVVGSDGSRTKTNIWTLSLKHLK